MRAFPAYVALAASSWLLTSCSLLLDPVPAECSGQANCTRSSAVVAADAGPAMQCAEACAGATPHCDPSQNRCVQCLRNDQCAALGLPARCDSTSGRCIECWVSSDCEATDGRPFCDTDRHTCVQCLNSGHCPDAGVCDPARHSCVACLEDVHCTDPDSAQCDPRSHTCVGCSADSQCAHIPNGRVCDLARERCVQCTATSEADCEGQVCDLSTQTCSDRIRGSKGPCEACTYDSECLSGDLDTTAREYRCVPLNFQLMQHGSYCLPIKIAECQPPYSVEIASVASTSGVTGLMYCGINELNTTCEAVRTAGRDPCSSADERACGDPELDGDGLCRTVQSVADRCTYTCRNHTECRPPMICDTYCR